MTLTIKEPPFEFASDDGLLTPPIGEWGMKKYELVHMYDRLFSTGMKNLWGQRVYIDLCAGSGKAKLRTNGKIVLGSPLLALSVANPFDRYIFCEENPQLMSALKQRVNDGFPSADARFVTGDCNEKVAEILSHIPAHSKDNKVLSFCFVDPFSLNIDFQTIQSLSTRFMDFLILLMLMDPLRNEAQYVGDNDERINRFLGDSDWRNTWMEAQKRGQTIRRFLAEQFATRMIAMGYRDEARKTTVEVRSNEKNLPLYHLSFFSKSKTAYKFWKEVRKYATDQTSLDL